MALGVEGNLDSFKSLNQNWTTHGSGSPVEEVIHNYDDLEFWGVIRLPFIDDLDIEKDSYVKTTKRNGKMAKKYIGDWNGVPTYTEFLKIGTRHTGQRLDSGHPKFLVFHDTGNRNSTAQQNVNYYNNTYNQPWATTASAHVFVDDKECINCVPLEEKAWHVLYDAPTDNLWYGDDANDIAVGVEACYFSDKERSRKSFDNACEIAAFICKEYGINPRNQMPGHYQIQADKIDPKSVLEACGYSKDM